MRAPERQAVTLLRDVTTDATIALDLVDPVDVERPIVRPRGGQSVETIAVHTVIAKYPGPTGDTTFDLGGFLVRASGERTAAVRWVRDVTLDGVPDVARPWATTAASVLGQFATSAGALYLRATGQHDAVFAEAGQ